LAEPDPNAVDWDAKCLALNEGTPTPKWDAIPEELATRQQWLLWKFEPPRKGSAKPLKTPFYVSGGRRVGVQGDDKDLTKLATLAVVRRVYERKPGAWAGVGFTFLEGDGLIGVDIDGHIDAAGEVSDMCKNVIASCSSYTELSPSRRGLHIICRGSTHINKFDPLGLEVYSGKLYFTFTGDRIEGTPEDIRPISDEALQGLHRRIDQAKEEAAALKAEVIRAASPPPAPRPTAYAGDDDFRKVNDAAMACLQVWVPMLFPAAKRSGAGYRVSSEALNRELQEDLSIKPEGIVDFGVADMGDPRDGKRTPIDLVMQWGGQAKAKDALHWLAQRIGVEIRRPGDRQRTPPPPAADIGIPISTGAGGGGDGPPDDRDIPPTEDGGGGDDDYSLGALRGKLIRTGSGKPADCRENVLYCLRYDPTS
jgi:putative DNA primase/helicase